MGGGKEASCRHTKGSVNAKVQVFACSDPFALSQQPKSIREFPAVPEAGTVQPPGPIPWHGYHRMELASRGLCLHPCSAPRLDLGRQLQQGFYSVQQNLAVPGE